MQVEGAEPRRPVRQDTFDMRNKLTIVTDDSMQQSDDDLGEEHSDDERVDDDDVSSELSVPDASINFDLVYAIRTFAATVDGQANVYKGDSLVLMDDSNSYWWLVTVLKTGEVGYIPAEIIETPFERLARLNKHLNQTIAAATKDDEVADPGVASEAFLARKSMRDARDAAMRSVFFTDARIVHNYPPAVWREGHVGDDPDDDDEDYDDEDDDDGSFEDGAFDDVEEPEEQGRMEPDDGMDWHRDAVSDERSRRAEQQQAAEIVARQSPDPRVAAGARLESPSRESFHQSRTPTPTTLLPSAVMQQERNAAAAAPQQQQKLAPPPGAHIQRRGSDRRVLRKERSTESATASDDTERKEKKKKGGILSSLFGRKHKDKTPSAGSVDSLSRSSEETAQSLADSKHSSVSSLNSVQRAAGPSRTPLAAAIAPPAQKTQARVQQQYLQHSPANSPLSSASTVSPAIMDSPGGRRPRPGSLIMSPGAVPELNVMRVFAGDDVRVEATFKTVLVNASTTAEDLVKQALQRFHIRENPNDFYLSVKRLSEGGSAALRPDERPLSVFEQLVEAAQMARMPKVKRTSVGSISSLASNLSMHPAIASLGMNDFADDSAVRFYLNRNRGAGMPYDEDLTLMAADFNEVRSPRGKAASLKVDVPSPSVVQGDRFSSPTARFALQLFIFPDDLPSGLAFDGKSETIVQRSKSQSAHHQRERRKVLFLPENTTVGEVIELGLDRFGILEGVVDGGDEVEDKLAKRRSQSRVRYNLTVQVEGEEYELSPTSLVLDAFPYKPKFINNRDGRDESDAEEQENGQHDDPAFILRRAVRYRQATSRSRLSSSLDEVELQQRHRKSASASSTASSNGGGINVVVEDHTLPRASTSNMTRQELIAAQREASRANQRAILSAQSNSERGVDIVLPNRALLRSSRLGSNTGAAVRYSYVEPDGETYDIGDILEEEWREESTHSPNATASREDLLKGAVAQSREGLINRVISKIKDGKHVAPLRDERLGARTPPDSAASLAFSEASTISTYSNGSHQGLSKTSRATTPSTATSRHPPSSKGHKQQPSVTSAESVQSSLSSGPSTPSTTVATTNTSNTPASLPNHRRAPLILHETDFGVSRMLARIEQAASAGMRQQPRVRDPYGDLDAALFGPHLDVNELHPSLRDVYQDTFRQLDDFDSKLDQLLQTAMRA